MPGDKVTINARKYDLKIRKSWSCDLIEKQASLLVFLGVFDEDITHPGLGDIKRGTLSYEYYWLDRWYNVFRFHEPDGSFRSYYCNINMPPTLANNVLDYVDLDIDILVGIDGEASVVDQDDFEENAVKYGYPTHLRKKVEETVGHLLNAIEQRQYPFDYLTE